MPAEKMRARRLPVQTLAGEVRRLRQGTVEEADSQKLTANGVRDEVKDVLERSE